MSNITCREQDCIGCSLSGRLRLKSIVLLLNAMPYSLTRPPELGANGVISAGESWIAGVGLETRLGLAFKLRYLGIKTKPIPMNYGIRAMPFPTNQGIKTKP